MPVAALYDIHANLPALEAVLADLDAGDDVVIGGDFTAGPMPAETVDALRALGELVRFIRGNADRGVAAGGWEADRLGPDRLAFVAGLPESVVLEVDGLGSVRFCHGSPRGDEDIITAATPEARLRRILAGVQERVVVCGHTHHQFDRAVDRWRVVNAGSIGLPYEGRPGAYWARLGPEVEHRRTAYDLENAAARIVATGHPDAAEWVETLREPRAAADVAAHFESLATG